LAALCLVSGLAVGQGIKLPANEPASVGKIGADRQTSLVWRGDAGSVAGASQFLEGLNSGGT
jgi:hypothetical protein